MYKIYERPDCKFNCEVVIQDGTERWVQDNLTAAIDSVIKAAKVLNHDTITTQQIEIVIGPYATKHDIKYEIGVDSASSYSCQNRCPNELVSAARKLVNKLKEVGEHPSFNGIFTVAYVLGEVYEGPNWQDELDELNSILAKFGE